LHETARLRWAGNARYRPAPMAPFANDVARSLRAQRAA
jgi:hypothetical protein